MKNWWNEKPSKGTLILFGIGLALIMAFGWVVCQDWAQYQLYFEKIMIRAGLEDPREMDGAFGGVVLLRGCLYLIPAFVLMLAACAMHYNENKRPKYRK